MQDQEEIKLGAEEKGWLGKIKDGIYENWQTILVALIVLIVGISAYNYNTKSNSNPNQQATTTSTNSQQTADQTNATANQEATTETKDQATAAANDQTDTTTTNSNQPSQKTDSTKQTNTQTKTTATNTNTVQVDGENYVATAAKGDGLTHLARKALNKYLEENKDDQITSAHKIYIEDYLRKHVTRSKVNVGFQETFSKSSIESAIASSKKLSTKSLNNLKKYSVVT